MKSIFRISLLIVLVLLTACKSSAPENLPPEEILSRAIARIQAVKGFHFTLESSGTPAMIDTSLNLAFSRADGDYVAPDRLQGKVKALMGALTIEVGIVSIGDSFWETNPLTQAWEQFPVGAGFNPAVLFDPQRGIPALLKTELSDLKLTGTEKLDKWPGKALYALSAQLKGETIGQLTQGLIGPENMTIQVWVAPKTFDVYRIQLSDPAADGTTTTWTLDFLKFDQMVDIQPPATQP